MGVEDYDILTRAEPAEARAAVSHVRQFLKSDEDPRWFKSFDANALKELNWIAIPVENYPEEEQIDRLAAAARDRGVESALAVKTESMSGVFVVSFETDIDLWNVSGQAFLSTIVLVEEAAGFALLYDGSYFSVLAGSPKLLEEVLGKPLDEAREEFGTYVGRLVNDGRAFQRWLFDELERYSAT